MQIRSDLSDASQMKLAFSNVEGLQLLKGELVQAVVEKGVGEGLFLVNIKGVAVEAATNLMLAPGQSLLLRSDGTENGRLMLRLVKPDKEHSIRVANHLQGMGYKVDDRLTAAATKLIQYGLPLTRENVDFTLNSTRWLGEFNASNLETAAWALAGGLKNNPDVLTAIRGFFTKPESVKQILQQVLQNLSVAKEPSGEAFVANLPILRSAPQGGTLLSTLLPVVNGLGGSVSTNTANPLEGKVSGNAFPVDNQRMNSIEGLLKAIHSLITVRGTDNPESIKQDLQRFIGTNKEVIRVLALIREVLVNSPEAAKPIINEAMQLLQAAEEELLGQAAFNSAERQTTSQQPGYYYLAIPVEVNGRDRTMELRIYKDDRGNRRLDELEEIRLAISLSTANLGMVVFHVTWQKDTGLIMQGVVNNSRFKEIIEQDFDSLRQRLMEIGYQVQFLGIKVTAEPERLRPGFETKESGSHMLGIDIRV